MPESREVLKEATTATTTTTNSHNDGMCLKTIEANCKSSQCPQLENLNKIIYKVVIDYSPKYKITIHESIVI